MKFLCNDELIICNVAILLLCFLLSFYLPPAQKLNKAAVATLEFQLTAKERGRVSVTGTDCSSSACLRSSWLGRRTSPARRTTSGRLRNPAVFVSPSPGCASAVRAPQIRDCNSAHVCADECREGCIINGQIIPAVCLAETVDLKTIGGLID